MKDLKGTLTGKTFSIEKVDDDLYVWELWKHRCSITMDEEEFIDIIDILVQHVLDGLLHKFKTESDSGCN